LPRTPLHVGIPTTFIRVYHIPPPQPARLLRCSRWPGILQAKAACVNDAAAAEGRFNNNNNNKGRYPEFLACFYIYLPYIYTHTLRYRELRLLINTTKIFAFFVVRAYILSIYIIYIILSYCKYILCTFIIYIL